MFALHPKFGYNYRCYIPYDGRTRQHEQPRLSEGVTLAQVTEYPNGL